MTARGRAVVGPSAPARAEKQQTVFGWHGDTIIRDTAVCRGQRNAQDVRRFLVGLRGADFRFDRAFMAGIGDGAAKSLGEVVDERRRHHAGTSPSA